MKSKCSFRPGRMGVGGGGGGATREGKDAEAACAEALVQQLQLPVVRVRVPCGAREAVRAQQAPRRYLIGSRR